MERVNEILDLIQMLSEEERTALIRQMMLSLEPEDYDPNQNYEEQWQKEIQARLEHVERGEHQVSDWREAVERIHNSLPTK